MKANAENDILLTYRRGLDLSGTLSGAGGIGGLLAQTDTNGSRYFHSDVNGNITGVLDGSFFGGYEYDPFGNVFWSRRDLSQYRFAGKKAMERNYDGEMYDFGHRWYMPQLERWLTADPLGEPGFEAIRRASPFERANPCPAEVLQGPNLYTTF